MSRNKMLDTGDLVSAGDNGGFGGAAGLRSIVRHHGEDVQLGGEPIAASKLVMTVLARLGAEGIDAGHVDIFRDGRDLILRGRVATTKSSEVAESVARGTPGVTSVVNELSIDQAPPG